MKSGETDPIYHASLISTLLTEKGLEPHKPGYEALALELSAAAAKSPTWSWQYVRGIHKGDGKITAGKRMVKAIHSLLATLDDVPLLIASSTPATVMQTPGSNVDGALIDGKKRLCAHDDCAVWFVPNTSRRKYCYVCSPVRTKK